MNRSDNITPFIVMDILKKARKFKDIIHMEVGEPDLPPSPLVSKALRKAVDDGIFYYTDAVGMFELRKKISLHYKYKYNLNINPDRIIVTPGTSGAFLAIMGTLLNKGDKFAISDPAYPCYKNFGYFLDLEPALISIDSQTDFEITPDLLSPLKNIRALIISSPSNPMGNLYKKGNLMSLIEYCNNHNINFISDEIYHGLVYDQKEASALEFSDNVIVINGFSKSFCMPGLRIGWMIVPESLKRKVEIILQNITIATNTHAQIAACKAFDYDYIKTIHNIFKSRRDLLYKGLSSIFKIWPAPEGAFYIWCDISAYNLDSLEFSERLLEEEHVAITPGIDFGNNNTCRFVRFAYTRDIKELKEGIGRIKRFVNRL